MTQEKIEIIADWLYTTGLNNTESGNYHISFEDVAELYEEPLEEIIKHKEDIAAIIDAQEEIISPTWLDEDFDMMFSTPDD